MTVKKVEEQKKIAISTISFKHLTYVIIFFRVFSLHS